MALTCPLGLVLSPARRTQGSAMRGAPRVFANALEAHRFRAVQF